MHRTRAALPEVLAERVDSEPWPPYSLPSVRPRHGVGLFAVFDANRDVPMKVRSSLKSLKGRHRDCKVVRRKGVVYVINKTDPRFKAKQG